ncbi:MULTISPECIES: quinone oxidoreductase family protein [unclassified Sphingobium]|uniref:quinone oxidoreductase family protein n=1 Tax=unclassified Sphingobium TaxID=2611147 RepID=UPI0007701766|nr:MULTISPECIES: quinone oxidoreductase [unclassified Sphingobium]AMK21116.1 NADPH:quinone oxidoreductase [Sphingobium sp. TKS]NML89701.1 quinone oxidoreductase [Sphingobium sp. TB-6]
MTKVIVMNEVGGADKMQVEDWDVPPPGAGEIKVRHEAIGLNFVDVLIREGHYDIPTPFVLGQEAAGVVTEVGAGVTEFKLGARVAYMGATGAFSEERNVAASIVFPIPDGVDFDTAAAITLKGMTVYYLFHMTHKLQPGETILFHGAAGGVGQIAVQWAKHIGATVIATVSSEEKVALARESGADYVIDNKTENFVERVKEITGGKGVDVVYDSVGKDTFQGSLDCLRTWGLMVNFGHSSGRVSIDDIFDTLAPKALYLARPILPTHYTDRQVALKAAAAMYDLAAKGVLKIKVGQRFPLTETAKAHVALENRQTIGSTIIDPR